MTTSAKYKTTKTPQSTLPVSLTRSTCAFLLAIILFSTGADSQAQTFRSPTISFTSSTNKTQIADPFTVQLEVIADTGTKVILPPVPEQMGEFDIIDHQDQNDLPSGTNQRIWRRTLTLDTISTGNFEIPPVTVQAITGDRKETLTSQSIPITVVSVLEPPSDPTQFREIRSVIDLESPNVNDQAAQRFWLYAGLVTLAVTVLIAGLYLARRQANSITPAAWANKQLASLQASEDFRKATGEVIASDLSRIVRKYLEMQFDVSAPTQSTDELIEKLQASNQLAASQTEQFKQLLENCDLVKFAGLKLTHQQLENEIATASNLIKSTSPSRSASRRV